MDVNINDLTDAIFEQGYKYGWQHRNDMGEKWEQLRQLRQEVAEQKKQIEHLEKLVGSSASEIKTLRQQAQDGQNGWVAAEASHELAMQELEKNQTRATEIETLREEVAAGEKALQILARDRDHWRESREQAIEAGELMQAEIETLRKQLADAKREASEEFAERQLLQHEASVDNAELERLRAFAAIVRDQEFVHSPDVLTRVEMAIAGLDAASAIAHAPANPTPASEPTGGAE